MTITCKFELTRASKIYYSGEYIEGSLTICPIKRRKVQAILLEFYGQTKVAWLDLDKTSEAADQIVHNDFSSKELSMKTLYTDCQKHVCKQLQLTRTEQLLQPHVDYRFEFRFLIPLQAAATSRCPLGECEYGLQVIVQHPKKVNKEFRQRIVVKNKLDLSKNITLQEPRSICRQNDTGQIILMIPCSGFTPGQKVPYHLKCQASQSNCKIAVQLNCLITCRSRTPHSNLRQIKQTINLRKHLPGETVDHLNLPLDCHISREYSEDSILKFEYMLEALLVDGSKKILLATCLPLTIGTTPCLNTQDVDVDVDEAAMCYDNYGSSHCETVMNSQEADITNMARSMSQQLYESRWLLPIKRKTQLRRSLSYCYKKIVKLI